MSFKIITNKQKDKKIAININAIQFVENCSDGKTTYVRFVGDDGLYTDIEVDGDLRSFTEFLNSDEIEYKAKTENI